MSHHNPSSVPQPGEKQPGLPTIEIRELGGRKEGVQQAIDRRLFMQLLVFRVPKQLVMSDALRTLYDSLEKTGMGAVVYEDAHDPWSLGLLSWSENPEDFVTKIRPLFHAGPLHSLELRADMGMLGRSYGGGHEPELEYWILQRPRDNALGDFAKWAVWYPLRRKGEFNRLDPHEQGMILKEHAQIGIAYGQADLAHDIRLASFGMDTNDNDFVIGLLGSDLHRLSHVVQAMRKTVQTSKYIEKMGPFFVGRRVWKTAGRS